MKLKTEKSQIKINETKMWFFGGKKKPNKIHNHPGRLAKKKKINANYKYQERNRVYQLRPCRL